MRRESRVRRRPTVLLRAAAVLRVLLRAARVLHAGHGKRQLRRTRLGLEALRRRLLREGLVDVLRRHHRIHALTTRRGRRRLGVQLVEGRRTEERVD